MLVKKTKRRLKDKSYAKVFLPLKLPLGPGAGDRITDHSNAGMRQEPSP